MHGATGLHGLHGNFAHIKRARTGGQGRLNLWVLYLFLLPADKQQLLCNKFAGTSWEAFRATKLVGRSTQALGEQTSPDLGQTRSYLPRLSESHIAYPCLWNAMATIPPQTSEGPLAYKVICTICQRGSALEEWVTMVWELTSFPASRLLGDHASNLNRQQLHVSWRFQRQKRQYK